MIADAAVPDDAVVGDPDDGDAGGDPVAYLDRVMAEIEADVEERRRRGDLPDGLEEELDRLFLEFSPVGLHGGDDRLTKMLALVDSAASFNLAPPTASQKMVGGQVKRAVAQTVGWYVNFMMGQVGSFAWAVSRALHVVADQVSELEREVATLRDPGVPAGVVPAPTDSTWWQPVARASLAGAPGRVLHADCGDGALVAALMADGVDAYGVDPSPRDGGIRSGTTVPDGDRDLREDALLDHLAAVGTGELHGVVLSGSVQWLDARQRARLVELLGSRVALGGTVVLHSAFPGAWVVTAPVLADLAPGRPLHAETWEVLLTSRGFEVTDVAAGGAGTRLEPLEGTGSEVDTVNALVTTVNQRLLGPSEYVLVAARVR